MKKLIIRPKFFLLLFTVICWGLTPYIFCLADLERGYDATGGEIFIPLLPVIVWAFIKTMKD